MCGINGFNFSDRGLVLKMNQATRHRGPDATGDFVDERVSLGHNLLAITETPSNGRQPFVSPDGNHVLIYNGEIYNYKLLRADMEARGVTFATDSDTEVLFEGLIRDGKKFIESLDGMFAFAFYDKRKKILLLARDSSGIKPLYYYGKDAKFVFSSEIRGILACEPVPRNLSYNALNIYFLLGYVPGPLTLFDAIRKVCPGECLEVNVETGAMSKSWFDLGQRRVPNTHFSPESFREKISKAVLQHTQGLRPLGLYLSGGLDSSIIFYELFKEKGNSLKTYTTRFEVGDDYYNNDATLAKKMTAEYGNDHHELLVRENDFIDSIEPTIFAIEEPRWVPHIATHWLLAKYASKDIVVVLNGSGGDELFLGYQKQFDNRRIRSYYRKYPKFLLDIVYTAYAIFNSRIKPAHFLPLSNLVQNWAYVNNVWFNLPRSLFNFPSWDTTDVAKYLVSIGSPPITSPLPDEENALGDYDRLFWLADEEFLRTDKITMHFGMEGRFPLLARDVQQYANSVPSNEKIVNGVSKRISRDAYRGYLPDYIVDKAKTGWKSPVTIWMESKLGDYVREILSDSYYEESARLFNLSAARRLINKDKKNTISNLKQFMPIFSFQIWARQMKIRV